MMRIIDKTDPLHDPTKRARGILKAIIKEYIETFSPVSSSTVASRHCVGLSPATIRNIMAELEKEGYLDRPHCSAGRVPTDKSFRLYVDTLDELEEPREEVKCAIKSVCNSTTALDSIMRETLRTLSTFTHCAGFLLMPGPAEISIKHIKLLPADASNIVVIITSTEGVLHTKVIRDEEAIGSVDLEKMSNYLNSISNGITLYRLRDRVAEEMKNEKNLYDTLIAETLRLIERAIRDASASPAEKIYLEGKTNIFEQPEFKEDIEKMKRIFAAFEEKNLMLKILDKSIKEDGINIFIGSECDAKEFEGLSFVTASYGKKESLLTTIGVIGPVRMDYSRIIPLVNYTAESLSKTL